MLIANGKACPLLKKIFNDTSNDPTTDFEETIYGGHDSSGRPPPGPRVTEVIQEDGQMTIEMEIDGERSFTKFQKIYVNY